VYKVENIYVTVKIDSKEHIYSAQIFPRTVASDVRKRHTKINVLKFSMHKKKNEEFAITVTKVQKVRVRCQRPWASIKPNANTAGHSSGWC
jgi:chemotaxis signal transduction protein